MGGGGPLSSPARSDIYWGYEPQTRAFKPRPSQAIWEAYVSFVWCPVACIYGCVYGGWMGVGGCMHTFMCFTENRCVDAFECCNTMQFFATFSILTF